MHFGFLTPPPGLFEPTLGGPLRSAYQCVCLFPHPWFPNKHLNDPWGRGTPKSKILEKVTPPGSNFFIGLKPSLGHGDQEYIRVGSCISHGLGGDRPHTYIHTDRQTGLLYIYRLAVKLASLRLTLLAALAPVEAKESCLLFIQLSSITLALSEYLPWRPPGSWGL